MRGLILLENFYVRRFTLLKRWATEKSTGGSNCIRFFVNIPVCSVNPERMASLTAPSPAQAFSTTSNDVKTKEGSNHQAKRELDDQKRVAAFACVDKYVKDGYAVGVGTGSTSSHAVHRLAEKYRAGQLKDIVCVPSSFDTRRQIIENHLPLSDLERYPELDLYIDGADEVDEELNCIKGGGGCLTQEKIVMSCAKYFYIIGDSSKNSQCLGDKWKSIPVEVVPLAYAPIKRRIEQMEGGHAQLRMASRKAGPLITDNGNFILDWAFPKLLSNGRVRTQQEWTELNVKLKLIPGVVETGLFLAYAQAAYFGQSDGSVMEKKANGDRRISMSTNKRALSPDVDGTDHVTNGKPATQC